MFALLIGEPPDIKKNSLPNTDMLIKKPQIQGNVFFGLVL